VKEELKPGLMSVDDALSHLLGAASLVTEIETVATIAAAGRVLAAAQVSTIDVPGMDTSMMDGYAVSAADVAAAMQSGGGAGNPAPLPVSQRIPAGQVGTALSPGTVARIFTGAKIPEGADAVVMQEACEVVGDTVKIKATPRDGEWITRQGADIAQGRQILEQGVKLRAQDAGLAASVGLAQLPVYRRLKVAVFFTGDELVMPGEKLPPGAIYNSNRFVLNGLLRQSGCDVTDFGIVPDRLDATRAVLREAAAGHDLILTSGGVSVGEEDHVRPAVEVEGKLSLWRIAMKPGRPLAFGHVGQGARPAAFIGLPGNPVSSFVTFLIFVRPFILKSQGVRYGAVPVQAMRADFDWATPDARREFMRVKLNAAGGLDLYPNQASAVLTSTVWADGLIDNPERHAIKRGDLVRYMPFSALFE
jgi:molybdopterin molybdotransferase